MLDFVKIATKNPKSGVVEVYPKFVVKNRCSDLMIRGGDFYAVYDEETGLWRTDEDYIIDQVDAMLDERAAKINGINDIQIKYMWDCDSGSIDKWHKYCTQQMRDSYHILDEKIIFSNTKTSKKDYASKKLAYPLEDGDISAYEELMNTLYDGDERAKLEWAIGSIIKGDSKKIQKFIVLYGAAGSGKSTVLNIIQMLFDGYYNMFDAKELASRNNSFALESFKTNPLVSIQHDGDLSKIEDNTKLNSIVSHEKMEINEKFKSRYSAKFNTFLFMGTNRLVKITEAKSGLIRRLIDVTPSGRKVTHKRYNELMSNVEFELGAIAKHCLDVYEKMGPSYYDSYVAEEMISGTNDFYDFIEYNYYDFRDAESVTLSEAWKRYKLYCDEAGVQYPMSMRNLRVELKEYFDIYESEGRDKNGKHVRSVYSGFRTSKFEKFKKEEVKEETNSGWLKFDNDISLLDGYGADWPAQYANEDEKPISKWSKVKTKLRDISTNRLHYVKVPENHIVIDFDIKGKDGKKSYKKNLEAANKFPPTYAELSKSGNGIHLHYIYDGDVDQLSRIYDENIEVKIFKGDSSLRRCVTKCNDIVPAVINTGLPLKEGGNKMVDEFVLKNEKQIRTMIKKNLAKEYHDSTKPSIDYIYKILDDAYNSGLNYDVSDLKQKVLLFAMDSTNQAEYCVKLVNKMKFKSEEPSASINSDDEKMIFYDIEVFPNLFLINWKYRGSDTHVHMINPSSAEVEELLKKKLVGYNCRRYDNHICHAAMMGYTNKQLFNLSQKIINGERNAMFGEAYNHSYTDVYDFCSKKQSLKKWEIELGIHHKELGLPWDQPVPKELWQTVSDYCDNDVDATEATFEANIADFEAREILVELANIFAPKTKSTVNDTTNTLTGRIIFGDDKNPQSEFVYTDLSKEFPGYSFEGGKSVYMDEEVGEGGYVYAEPGMYGNAKTFDVASMHPHSVIALNLFGDKYTKRFKMLVDLRIMIKHGDFESARKLFDGALEPFLQDPAKAKALAAALKIAINSVYGLTAAKFDNKFRDIRNVDNIVAKRGALFMVNLKHEVQKQGYKVIHIKTDSIKVENPDKHIEEFIYNYGKKYGYTFEVEDEFSRICLVNDAVYIAKEKDGNWTATGAQFAHPYVFKTLFSKEPLIFEDYCETKSVSTALYLDMNEKCEDDHNYIFVGKVGQFCPIREGAGGGLLLREKEGKYSYAGGAKGYRWLESEMVKTLNKEDDIDMSYFNKLVDDAVNDISKFGDFEWFTSDSPDFMRVDNGKDSVKF